MKTVCVCGHFGFGREFLDGQTVKTRNIYDELAQTLGEEKVCSLDTYGGKKAIIRLVFGMLRALKNCHNVVILPAQNGIRFIPPLLMSVNTFFNRKLHYVVIGGWLDSFLENRKALTRCLKRFHCIYVETSTMKNVLENGGFKNVLVMPNCKSLQRLTEDELVYSVDEPYKLCTFSRVMWEKGIGTAVEAVKEVNQKLGRTACALDIYGPVDGQQTEWFEELCNSFPEYVRYCGTVAAEQSVGVLKDYFALLFPTIFYTEGIPGTIIDAYAAGVPVIASRWESFSDVVNEETGIGYDFEEENALAEAIETVIKDPGEFSAKKIACLRRFSDFSPEVIREVLIPQLEQ